MNNIPISVAFYVGAPTLTSISAFPGIVAVNNPDANWLQGTMIMTAAMGPAPGGVTGTINCALVILNVTYVESGPGLQNLTCQAIGPLADDAPALRNWHVLQR